ncbi:transmembrane GTPase fzo1 [Amanita muscaria]
MAHPYSPAKGSSTAFALDHDKVLKVEDVQDTYVRQKESLVGAIDATKSILSDLRAFNKHSWVVRYPQFRDHQSQGDIETCNVTNPKRCKALRRSLSFADDPSFEADVIISGPRNSLTRTATTLTAVYEHETDGAAFPSKEVDEARLIPTDEFNVLRLDLKLGAHSSPSSVASLVTQLEKSSIANLLDDRVGAAMAHIDKLRLRVEDTSSKVLVTGDLNAGKSTFVNALLRREVMPVDQQPCTTAFCEVHDAAENDGKEEVHVLKDGITYDIKDESTYTKGPIAELEEIITENESTQPIIKVYLAGTRAPSESLLNNGVVDISLIDAPGLNRDSLKTTAVFTRQEEIDVVVFVVSAENHFTLSAKEFLWNASNEKAYLFIVVNKFDQIRNKEKCKRLVLEQIKHLSPRTYDDAEELVHFVDSATALQPYAVNPAFDDLETALRSFVLVKRLKSKLQPVSTYMTKVLSDVEVLARANAIVADVELQRAREELDTVRPVVTTMRDGRELLDENLEAVEEEGASKACQRTKHVLNDALDRVAQGRLGADRASISLPSYPGFFHLWQYACDLRKAYFASLDAAVKQAEDEARLITATGVNGIRALEEKYLPEGVERSKRVFIPEAMFRTVRRSAKGIKGRRPSSAIVAGGLHGLGIGLAQRQDMLETSFSDLFDVQHQFSIYIGNGKGADQGDLSGPAAFTLASIGVSAVTMVGSQIIGARGLLEGIFRVTDLLGNETTRKWVAPVLGAVTVGLTAYLILELPSSIPRNVGRRIRASLVHQNGEIQQVFVDFHAARVSKETRKVLRLASYDTRSKFGTALEDREKAVRDAEETEKRASSAKEWCTGVGKRTEEVCARLAEDEV